MRNLRARILTHSLTHSLTQTHPHNHTTTHPTTHSLTYSLTVCRLTSVPQAKAKEIAEAEKQEAAALKEKLEKLIIENSEKVLQLDLVLVVARA